MAPDKSVKTRQEFGQGSVKDGQGFEGRTSIWTSDVALGNARGGTPHNSGRGDYPACYADRSEPLIAGAPGLGQIAFRGAIRPEQSRIFASSRFPQAAGDSQLCNALANEHQVLIEHFQRAAHVVGNVRRSVLLDPVRKLLIRGAQGELVLIEAVEQAGDQFGVRHGVSPCFERA